MGIDDRRLDRGEQVAAPDRSTQETTQARAARISIAAGNRDRSLPPNDASSWSCSALVRMVVAAGQNPLINIG
jgi:hypothetical protein